jgi:hypothetical protein
MPDSDECVHHWVIEPANGTPLLRGSCKKCGLERDDFVASSDDPTIHRWVHQLNLRRSESEHGYYI